MLYNAVPFWCWLYSFRQRARLALFLWLAPDQECKSDSCLKFSGHNCGWAIRLKSIGLAWVVNCTVVLRISLLNLLMFWLLASKLSSECSRLIQFFSYLLHFTWGCQVAILPYPSIRLNCFHTPLLPLSHCCSIPPQTPPRFPLAVFPHSAPRGPERHSRLFGIVIPFFLLRVL